MLKKQNRLTKKKDFDMVFKGGRSVYGMFLGIKIFSNKTNINKYGISISVKVSKKAVERNRVKRCIRDVVKEIDQTLKRGFDIVIIVLPNKGIPAKEDVKNEIIKILKRLNLFV